MSASGVRIAGRYEMISVLGRGGIGEVFLCWDPETGKLVAVKRINALNVNDSDDLVARTRREANVLSRLRHRNIVGVYDFVEDYHGTYFVLEYIKGVSLDDWMCHHKVTMEEFLKIASQCLEGLGAAHRAGLLHLDLKPSNIMLSEREGGGIQVKLVDFGVSELSVRCEESRDCDEIMGSVYYIAPEQITQDALSPATDLYSLGLSFYHLLAGRLPYAEGGSEELCVARLEGDPPALAQYCPEIPLKLVKWVEGLIQRNPEQRWKNCQRALSELTLVAIDWNASLQAGSGKSAEQNEGSSV